MDELRLPQPVSVVSLFAEERAALLDLLAGLTEQEWDQPTECPGWSVRDVALHILGGDLGNLSRRRDGYVGPGVIERDGESIVSLVNRINQEWVEASRRLSSRVIRDLLAYIGPQLFDYFSSLDLSAMGGAVSWAGPDSAPVWLDVAREFTERWLHQQHIRDAVGKPGLTDRHFLAPILATFAYALPVAFERTAAPEGTIVHLRIEGEAGGDWALVRESSGWTLYSGAPSSPAARVSLEQSIAWRLFTKGMRPEEAERTVSFEGDRQLGERALYAVSIIA